MNIARDVPHPHRAKSANDAGEIVAYSDVARLFAGATRIYTVV